MDPCPLGVSPSGLKEHGCLRQVSSSQVRGRRRPGVAERIDRLPVTRTQRRATVVVGLGLFFELYELFSRTRRLLTNIRIRDRENDELYVRAESPCVKQAGSRSTHEDVLVHLPAEYDCPLPSP